MRTRRSAGWISALVLGATSAVAVPVVVATPADAASYPGQIAFSDGYNGIFRTQVGSNGAEGLLVAGAESAQWSPNGTRLAYLLEDDHSYDLVVADRLGTHPHTLLKADISSPTTYLGSDLAWSPDGSQIAYQCDMAYQSPDHQHAFGGQLCVYDLDTKKHTEVTDTADRFVEYGGYGGLSWSPDGRYVVATVGHTTVCGPEAPAGTYCHADDVGRITMATGTYKLLTDDVAMEPRYSPDGKHLVYYDPTSEDGEPTGVVVSDATGGKPVSVASLAELRGTAQNVYPTPTFSPDSELVLFSAMGLGDDPDTLNRYANLFTVKLDGSGPFKQLTFHQNNVYDAAWTPVLTTCTVPNLTNKTLAAAKTALGKAACGLGKVTGPTKNRAKLHVKQQTIKAGVEKPAGTKVGVRLG